MAEKNQQAPIVAPEESTKDHGCFDFMKRKDKEHNKTEEEDVAMADLHSNHQKHTLMDQLQRTHSHSSSSSEEEVEEGGERKKKKKKGLKDQENVPADNVGGHTTEIKCGENGDTETAPPEEKKGFLEKIKEKLPGQHKKGEDDFHTPDSPSTDQKEKKGIIDKIKDKLPGHHKEE